MLDKRSEALLRIINEECKEGSYKVLEVDDLIRSMPRKYKIDSEGIAQLMGYLSSGEYVSVKYGDEEVFCVSPLPRGRRIFEVEEEERKFRKHIKFKYFLFFIVGAAIAFGITLATSYISKTFLNL
ncbi:MAG: hypothetical protein MR024_02600 [Firmicutes bacterium]|nr:hypothetical protein [Bacillota bacterium]